MKVRKAYADLKDIFFAAVERVNPYRMIVNHLRIEGNVLKVSWEGGEESFDLNGFERVFVLGAGKATAKMTLAVEEILQDRIDEGVISVKYGHTEDLKRIRVIEAGHPFPDDKSVLAAGEIQALAERADEKTLAINLISGGGSALLTLPLTYTSGGEACSLSLEEKRETAGLLLACGATIREINCIRKHISRIKGGRLAKMLYPATSLNLILSDVVGDRLDTIASGLTVFDETTYGEAVEIVNKYSLAGKLPERVLAVLKMGLAGMIEETPKSEDRAFSKVINILIGSNYTALQAAAARAVELGYHTVVLSSRITGEAREVAKVYAGIAMDVKKYGLLAEKPACIIGGGETTVTIRGGGKGGRNQEMALSFLAELEEDPAEGITFLSASTDGNDGPTDAAGAFASLKILEKSKKSGLSLVESLSRNDSYHFFSSLGYLLKTGPTNTNVCDFQICLIH